MHLLPSLYLHESSASQIFSWILTGSIPQDRKGMLGAGQAVSLFGMSILQFSNHRRSLDAKIHSLVHQSSNCLPRPLGGHFCWLQAFLFFDVFSVSLRREQHRGSLHSGYETWKRHGRPSIPHSPTAKRSLGIQVEKLAASIQLECSRGQKQTYQNISKSLGHPKTSSSEDIT